jgi:hypothetical protein
MACRRGKLLVAIAATLVGVSLLSAPANAGTKCKSSVVSMGASNEDQLNSAWSSKVKHQYGAAWSNLNIAKDKQYTGQNQGLFTFVFLTAFPCKRT